MRRETIVAIKDRDLYIRGKANMKIAFVDSTIQGAKFAPQRFVLMDTGRMLAQLEVFQAVNVLPRRSLSFDLAIYDI